MIIGGGNEENGEIRRKIVLCVSRKGPRFMVALANQGLNNLGELGCWIFLVVGGSGIVVPIRNPG